MSEMNAEEIRSTPVTIFGRTYHLRGQGDPAYLAELAADVDRRMKEVADATGTADTLKVAILAALNVADERFQASRALAPTLDGEDEARLDRLLALLDEILGK
jgi:cell division protein ZapA